VRLALLLAVVLAIFSATPAVQASTPLQSAVDAAVGAHSGHIGVVVEDLATGERAQTNADEPFSAASLYKLFVLETAEAAIDNGSLDPTEILTLSDSTADADPYTDLQVGTRISVDCALQTMIEMSGNSASDLLIERLGLSTINARIAADGLSSTVVNEDTAFTSPADTAVLLRSIARGTSSSTRANSRMFSVLFAQQHNDRIPAPLPPNVKIAHKTGELPNLRHDAAIVFTPSVAYILVVMVAGAPTESDARGTIVDISRAVYDALTNQSSTSAGAIPARIAEQVYRVPDAQGRLALLGDPRSETAALPASIQTSSDADASLRLRPELISDLVAMQSAADAAGADFWLRSAFQQPTDTDAAAALPTEWYLPCSIEQPTRTPDSTVVQPAPAISSAEMQPASSADSAGDAPNAPRAHQAWLGTTFTLTDRPSGPPSVPEDLASPTWQWLVQHAASYGFVPALPETAPGATHEPWTLRWVGRDMASNLLPLDSADYPSRVTAALARAETELGVPNPARSQPLPWGLADACWTIPTISTAGCPSRWYFLNLPLS
jgi:beta-lactamase class A